MILSTSYIINWRRKSVAGFSIDLGLINVLGFLLYSVYNFTGVAFPELGTGIVDYNDLVFAIHSFFITSVALAQVFIYERGEQKHFKVWMIYLHIFICCTVLTTFFLEGFFVVPNIPVALNTLRFAGYGKCLITFIKYCPQVFLNWKRKSTKGWSIIGVLFDFSGSTLILGQILIDMIHNGLTTGDWALLEENSNANIAQLNPTMSLNKSRVSSLPNTDAFNIVKFMVGLISVMFNIIFIVQHFILYPENEFKNYPVTKKSIKQDEIKRLYEVRT
ncbi:unnamed protein product [Moneuplotes crassus]|uniref:Uncharacterized protein n=1 Tax=Euplotes crassus TaxID=5936 RepID=A0AAD1XNI7_EUPCR|nr:unnamed protein product [Moneuplotes crassus]